MASIAEGKPTMTKLRCACVNQKTNPIHELINPCTYSAEDSGFDVIHTRSPAFRGRRGPQSTFVYRIMLPVEDVAVN